MEQCIIIKWDIFVYLKENIYLLFENNFRKQVSIM